MLPSFVVGSQVIFPKAYVANSNMANLYDGATGYWGDSFDNIWIVFDLEGIDFSRSRPAGWRIWPRSGLTERVVAGNVDYGYDPAEGPVDWGVTSWTTNNNKRVIGQVSGVPSGIVWESDVSDIDKTTLEIAPGRFFVPYAKELRAKPPRYIRFRGFTNANCSEIELRTVRYSNSTGFVIIVR